MGRELKIKPTAIESKSKYIKPTGIPPERKISFNFRKLRGKDKKFCYQDCKSQYFKKLLERLRDISNMTRTEMTIQNSKGLRCHTINFNDLKVSENSFGFLGEDLGDDAWEFQITSHKHGRVHGYFVENIFHIVWLDPKHELYPQRL